MITKNDLYYTLQFDKILSYLIQKTESDIAASKDFNETGNEITPKELNAAEETFEGYKKRRPR